MNGIEEATIQLKKALIEPETLAKWETLTSRLALLDSALIAYSGGVDSTFLSYAAHLALGEKCLAVFIQTEVEAGFQSALADRWAKQGGFNYVTLTHDALADPQFVSNPVNRCYFCKTSILGLIRKYGDEHGYKTILEGQNLDDQEDYRPGRQAVKENGALSPLAEAGLTKSDVRSLAHALELPVWNQPSSPCLASRFPYGLPITPGGLRMVEQGEAYLHSLGFDEVRVRIHQNLARLEVSPQRVLELVALGEKVTRAFKDIGFVFVTVDLQGYRQGSLNEGMRP